MAPLTKALEENKKFHIKVCVTAQHREMLNCFGYILYSPDYDLDIMKHDQSLNEITVLLLLE